MPPNIWLSGMPAALPLMSQWAMSMALIAEKMIAPLPLAQKVSV
jgi:hypothetical protein